VSVRSSVDPEGRAVHGIVAVDKAVSNVALFADDEDVNDGMAMKAIRRDNRARGGEEHHGISKRACRCSPTAASIHNFRIESVIEVLTIIRAFE